MPSDCIDEIRRWLLDRFSIDESRPIEFDVEESSEQKVDRVDARKEFVSSLLSLNLLSIFAA
jgi:hypothetical protein